MTPKQVRSLLAVNQYGSIKKASQVIHLAPSSISAQLKELAFELGVDVFEQKGRNIQLNEVGLSLLPSFQAFCAQENHIKQLAQNYQLGLRGNITLFAPSSLCIYRLPYLIEKLQESEPELEVILIHEPYDYETALKQADINAAIIMTQTSKLTETTQGWHSTPLEQEQVIYVTSPDYFNPKHTLSLDELNQHALITTELECNYRMSADRHFAEAGLILAPKQSFSNVEVIKRCLLARMGIGLLPQCVVQDELDQGHLIKLNVIGTPYLFQSHIIYDPNTIDNKKLSAFLALV
jgi:DNA-binding transcriptional LysR family regulator